MKFMEKKEVNKASRSFAFGSFKSISHNKALQIPFSLGLFFIFFLCFPVALRVVDKKKFYQTTNFTKLCRNASLELMQGIDAPH